MELKENIQRIREVMGLNETFETRVDPTLENFHEEDGIKQYVYTLPSKKTDKKYYIVLTLFYKNNKLPGIAKGLENVMDIDFNLGHGVYKMTNLNEIYYLMGSIGMLLDKHKSEFQYLLVQSNEHRLSLYKKVLNRSNFLELTDENNGEYILYKNIEYV
jgi:hypothetical protein